MLRFVTMMSLNEDTQEPYCDGED